MRLYFDLMCAMYSKKKAIDDEMVGGWESFVDMKHAVRRWGCERLTDEVCTILSHPPGTKTGVVEVDQIGVEM